MSDLFTFWGPESIHKIPVTTPFSWWGWIIDRQRDPFADLSHTYLVPLGAGMPIVLRFNQCFSFYRYVENEKLGTFLLHCYLRNASMFFHVLGVWCSHWMKVRRASYLKGVVFVSWMWHAPYNLFWKEYQIIWHLFQQHLHYRHQHQCCHNSIDVYTIMVTIF